mgnify:CR=1 FL=1
MAEYSNKKIKSLLSMVVTDTKTYSKQAVVTFVDEDLFTCDVEPIDGTPELFEVMLTPTKNATNVDIPNVGSTVFVTFIDEKTAFISQMDSISKSVVRSSDENAEHNNVLLQNFADGMKDVIDNLVFTTPNGPTAVGPIESSKQQMQQQVDDFKEGLSKIYKE